MLSIVRSFLDSILPDYYLGITLCPTYFSLTWKTREELIEEKTKLFQNSIQSMTMDVSIEYIFSHMKHCDFIIFQTKVKNKFLQFAPHTGGFYFDFPMGEENGLKKYLPKLLEYLDSHRYKKSDKGEWSKGNYWISKEMNFEVLDVYFYRDISLIKDLIKFMLKDVYKEKYEKCRVILG